MVARFITNSTRGSNLFDIVRREMDDVVGRLNDWQEGDAKNWFTPRTDLIETDTGFEIAMDVPGMSADNFSVELKEGELLISGSRERTAEDKTKTYHHVERYSGEFRRTFALGHEVDADAVSAEYKDGVLHVVVPKIEKAQPRKIEVKS